MKLVTLKRRVRQWQRRAGLGDWDVQVRIASNLKVAGQRVNAANQCADQRATIEFDEHALNELDSGGLDHLICHELQHVIDDAEEGVFTKYLGSRNGEFYRAWRDAHEKAIDHRAAVLVTAYRRKRDPHSVR